MSTVTSSGQVSPPRVALMSSGTQTIWNNASKTAFNGFILVVLAIPSFGAGPTQNPTAEVDYGNLYPGMKLPLTQRIPVIQGLYNTACGLYVNDDLVPPGSNYVVYVYDSAGDLIIGPSSSFTVTSTSPVDPIGLGGFTNSLTAPTGTLTATTPDTIGT